MDGNRILKQMGAIFSVFMVFFYLGIGIYLAFFFEKTYLDKALRVIVGSTFIFYGIYRAYRAYLQIVEAFFTDRENSE